MAGTPELSLQSQEQAQDRSIVMVDWTRLNEPTPGTRSQFLWHQMILALLYGDVLAQDEIFLCSSRMVRWFGSEEDFGLLEQLAVCGGITVLKRPSDRYPDSNLRDKAIRSPISARREHLARFSVDNDGNPLSFGDRQIAFHDRLENLLARYPHAHRFAGDRRLLGEDLMKEFGTQLRTVLTDPRYGQWLRSNFRNITPPMVENIVKFIEHPDEAIEHIARSRPDRKPRFTALPSGPTFSTAVAVQVAATYGGKSAVDLQDLIETVFARSFCQDEGADGRYGKLLRDLPEASDSNEETTPDLRKVEVQVTIPVTLPLPRAKFGETIRAIRDSKIGSDLRNAMVHLGEEPNFARATNAWQEVSHELERQVGRDHHRIDVKMIATDLARYTAVGTLAEFAVRPPKSVKEAAGCALGPFVAGTCEIGGDVLHKLYRDDLQKQTFSRQLRDAVDFSCVRHPSIKPIRAKKN